MTDLPRLFHLQRDHDVTGVSGTGRVADGVLWPDGTVSIRWTGPMPSTVFWHSLANALHVHGHGGATRIVWADEQPAAARAARRDRIAEAALAAVEAALGDTLVPAAREEALAGIVAVLPPPADAPATECSAQNRNYESGPRLCIRAAQHHGDHIDERGFHWSDTVAVYPLADGTFRTGVNRAALRRMADETATTETDLTARLERGRAQLLEAMAAVSEDRTCCGWASDWARTLHAEGGIWETLGRAVGWPTGTYDRWVWVSWDEAAALYAAGARQDGAQR